MYLKAAAQCAVQQPFLRGDDSIRFGTELRGRSVLFLQKRDRFWQNREFSTNKLGLLTIYKSVIVPNTDNMKGLEAAAAAGIVAGKQEKKLEVIADVTPEQTKAIRAYLDQTDIKVRHVENGVTFDIILTVWKGEHSAQVRIAVFHTNIVHVEKDGEVLMDIPVHGDDEETLTDRSLLDMEHIWDFANTVDVEDVRSILEPQIRCNMTIAEEGLRGNYGANIGSVLLDMEGNDVRVRAKAYAAAGSDARMNGCEQPVVINSGSGNQGITTSVPVIVYARELGVSDEKLLRALTLSNLTTIHEKTPIGRLSAYCGAISAGAGAGAGIAYLCGGDYDAVIHTVVNALAVVSGVICDGAKASCAAKIATAVEAGLLGYNMYIRGNQFRAGDGIVAKGVENSLKNVGRLGKQGMKETNKPTTRSLLSWWAAEQPAVVTSQRDHRKRASTRSENAECPPICGKTTVGGHCLPLMRTSPLLLILYSLPDALCQLFGVQRLDDELGLAAHEAGIVDDLGRTLYLAHQHEDTEKQADQDGCEKDGEKLDELLKFHKWCGSAAAHSSPHSSFLRTSWSEAHSQV